MVADERRQQSLIHRRSRGADGRIRPPFRPDGADRSCGSGTCSSFYGASEALHGIAMDFPRHQVTALIGPSGCGKSTLLRCLNRMNDLIDDVRTTGADPPRRPGINDPALDVIELRRRVGMVFQRPTPFPKSIYENVAYGLRIAGIRDRVTLDETVESSLKRAALWDEVKDRLGESALGLSGGQHQRLCIARAIAVNPEIILMDEPCSALDPRSTARIEDLIGELRGPVHDHHRHPQHAAGGSRFRFHGVSLRGFVDRIRIDNPAVHDAAEEGNGRLHHRPLRLALWQRPPWPQHWQSQCHPISRR